MSSEDPNKPWWPQTILHVDMDAFFAAIEQRDNPELRGKPILVGGKGPRAVVTTASYEARPFGCGSAMPMAQARRLCPHAIVVKPRGRVYRAVSHEMISILESFSPLVEQISVDEAFVDITGSMRLFGSAVDIADQIKRRIFEELLITASVGGGPNRFIAKLSSDVNKPDGQTITPPQELDAWLSKRPIGSMWGVGAVTLAKLRQLGVETFGDLQALPVSLMRARFGQWGERMHALARGDDRRPRIGPETHNRTISHEQTFVRDVADPEALRRVLMEQVEMVARRLRRAEHKTRTMTLKIRDGSFETVTRSTTLPAATDRTDVLWRAARRAFEQWALAHFVPVRLLGVSLKVASSADGQLDLFGAREDAGARRIDHTTDDIIEKYGEGAITRGSALPSEADGARKAEHHDRNVPHSGHGSDGSLLPRRS